MNMNSVMRTTQYTYSSYSTNLVITTIGATELSEGGGGDDHKNIFLKHFKNPLN